MSENNSDSFEAKTPQEGIELENQGALSLSPESDAPNSVVSTNSTQGSYSEVDFEAQPGSQTLEEALEKFGIELSPKKVRLLKEYCELLWTWNERLNLTRHTTFDKFVSRDLVDAIHLANQLQKGEHVLDVGSGGGAPGLIVAILRPDVAVELCDATGKKAEALGSMIDELGLDLNVWYAKAEDLLKTRHFHTLTIRAVGKMRSLLLMFAPIWHTFDRILMIKGPNWLAERGEARHYNMFNSLALRKVDEYENPEAEHGSVILQICRKTRIAEMDRRAKERAEGKPYDGEIEEIAVDNRPREAFERHGNREYNKGKRSGFGRSERKNYPSRSSQRRSSDESSSSDQIEKTVKANDFARKANKPPKGWTGKKSEFKGNQSIPAGGTPSGVSRRQSSRAHSKGSYNTQRKSRSFGGKRSQNSNDSRSSND